MNLKILLVLLQICRIFCATDPSTSIFDMGIEYESTEASTQSPDTTAYKEIFEHRKEDEIRLKSFTDRRLFLNFFSNHYQLQEFEAFKTVQRNDDSFLIATSPSLLAVYLMVFSNRKVLLEEVIRTSRSNVLPEIEFLEVVLDGKDLWVFEASSETEMVVATRIIFERPIPVIVVHQALPEVGHAINLNPIFINGSVGLAVVSKNESNEASGNLQLELFTSRNWLMESSVKKSFPCSEHDGDLLPIGTKNSTFVILKCAKDVSAFVYHDMDKTFEVVSNISTNAIGLTSFSNLSSGMQYVVVMTQENQEIYLVDSDEVPRHVATVKPSTMLPFTSSLSFSNEGRDYFLFGNKENMSIYYQNVEGKFTFEKVFTYPCEVTSKVTYLSRKEEIILVFYCPTASGQIALHFGQLTTDNEILDNDVQMDSTYQDLQLEKCLDELHRILKDSELPYEYFINGDDIITDDYELSDGYIEEQNYNLAINDELEDLAIRVKKLAQKVMELGKEMKRLEAELPSLMTFETDQHIRASIQVPKMIANYSNILTLDLEELNGTPLIDYKTKFLLHNQDQLVTTNFYIDKVITKNIDTDTLSNNGTKIYPKDLLDSKSSDQVVTGIHSFPSLEVRNDIERLTPEYPLEINGISVDDLVTEHEDVIFEGTLNLSRILRVKNGIHISFLNEMNYEEWTNTVIQLSKDTSMAFDGSWVVHGKVKVDGDVKVRSINGVNIKEVYRNAAKISSSFQTISGPVEFQRPLEIKSLQLKRANGVLWNDFLKLKDKTVKPKFFIDDAVVLGDLTSNSINGLDLDKDVLLSGSDQTISGLFTFTSNLTVSGTEGVTMAMGATINEVDPSLHFSVHPNLDQEVINYEINFEDELKLNGDVRISTLNGVQFPDLAHNYWRKSIRQNIPVNVEVQSAVFRKTLHSQTFNGHRIDEYMFIDESQVVRSQNFFMNNVTVSGDLDMHEGKTIDGVDISHLYLTAVRLNEDQEIAGETVFEKGFEVESLTVLNGVIKNVSIEDELFGSTHLYPGKLIFREPVNLELLTLKGDLQVGTIGGMTAEEVLMRGPVPIERVKGNVVFDDLSADHVRVLKNLNGQNFNTWLKRTISKDISVLNFPKKVFVKGDITFAGSLDVHKVNSKAFENYLNEVAEDCENCKVTGKKIFTKPIEVHGDITAYRINGIDFKLLKERLLSRTKEQTVNGKYIFEGGVTAVSVTSKKIGKFAVNEIILTNVPAKLQGSVVFKSDVVFGEVESSGLIDGCNVEEALNPPLLSVGNMVSSNITFGRLKIEGDATFESTLLSGPQKLDVIQFVQRLVRKSKQQEITGPVTFKGPVTVHSLYTKRVNSITVNDFLERLSTNLQNVITECDVEFEDLIVSNITIGNLKSLNVDVNNLNIKVLSDLGVRRDDHKMITGKKEFLTNATIGNLLVDSINNFKLQDLIQLDDETIDQHIQFTETVYVNKDLQVNGLISQTDPEILMKAFVGTKTYPSIFPPYYDKVVVEGDLQVNSINGQKLNDLVLNSAKSQVITGQKIILGGISVNGAVHVDRLNGIDMFTFKRWSETTFPVKDTDSYVESLFDRNTGESPLSALKNVAFQLRHLNTLNHKYAEGLHKSLLYITEDDHIPLIKFGTINVFYLSTIQKLFAITEYKDCKRWDKCSCIETHTFKITGQSKLVYDELLKGQHIPLTSKKLGNNLFNFYSWCENEIFHTMVSHINFNKGHEVLVPVKKKNFGYIHKIEPFHSREKLYFVFLTTFFENSTQRQELRVMKPNFVDFWKMPLKFKATTFDLEKVCDTWYLLIVGKQFDEYDGSTITDETWLYTWNDNYEMFVLSSTFPELSSGHIVQFGSEAFMILTQTTEHSYEMCPNPYQRNDVEIYRSRNCGPFSPYTTLPVTGVRSTTSLIEGSDLFLVTASLSDHSITVYRRVLYEDFDRVASIAVAEPTAVTHMKVNGTHHLVVAAGHNSLILLTLHFKGTTISIEKPEE